MVPVALRCIGNRVARVDLPGLILKCPVTAAQRATGQIVAGGYVGAGELG